MSTEKKDIREYLHYYIGAYCWVQGQDEEKPIKLTGISWDDQTGLWWCYFENTETSYAVIKDVSPLLSKLEDLKGQDLLDAFHLSFEDAEYKFSDVETNEFGWRSRNQNGMECFMPNNSFIAPTFLYLLKKGYDLFGLIESGLAIDKKTTK